MKTKIRLAMIAMTLVLAEINIHAQTDSLLFRHNHTVSEENKGDLCLNIESLAFFKDNEFKGGRADGYTLPGFWLQPTLSLQPLGRIRLEAGIRLLKYWGADEYPSCHYKSIAAWEDNGSRKFMHAIPVFRVQLQAARHFQIVLGSIFGGSNHNLIEPLYNNEYNLSADPENGVQLLLDTRHFNFDAWVNWENFIFRGDEKRETFTVGFSALPKANARSSRIHTYFPVQILFRHNGGEINNPSGPRVQTLVNAAAGAGVLINTSNHIIPCMAIEAMGAYYGQQAGKELPVDNGYGILADMKARIWQLDVRLSYWYNHDFISIDGDPHFSAIGTADSEKIFKNNHLLKADIGYSYAFSPEYILGVSAGAIYMPGCDALEKGMNTKVAPAVSFSAGIYFRMSPDFLLKNIRK